MPSQKHSLTKYVIILTEKSNNYNYFALCRYCKTKITNTKRLVFSHLKSCVKFQEQHNEDERNKILYPEKYEEEETFFPAPPPYGNFSAMIFLKFVKWNN